jgi:elongation of very long chain fatty acids protein 4
MCAALAEKQREPLWLRALVQLHNVILILLSSFMCSSAAYNAWKLGYRFWGSGYSPAEADMGRTVYIFYISKLYEFMDTV